MSDFTQAQLVRLISQMIQIGTIVAVQVKPLRYKVQFTQDLTTDWIPADVDHAGTVKDFTPHQVGELVLVVKEFNTQGGVIVASLNQNSNDQPKEDLNLYYREFPDGTWIQYDMSKKQLSTHLAGEAIANIDGNVTVNIKGNTTLACDGDMTLSAKGNMLLQAARIDLNP